MRVRVCATATKAGRVAVLAKDRNCTWPSLLAGGKSGGQLCGWQDSLPGSCPYCRVDAIWKGP